ncbi:hypothetical protein GCM10022284_14830 [Streptomyces hundungensis]
MTTATGLTPIRLSWGDSFTVARPCRISTGFRSGVVDIELKVPRGREAAKPAPPGVIFLSRRS